MSTDQTDRQHLKVVLDGPATPLATKRRSFFGSKREWRSITIDIEVGGADCPDLESARLILFAIQDMIKLADGTLSDAVVSALRAHTCITDYTVSKRD
jgi:hypothetical protein